MLSLGNRASQTSDKNPVGQSMFRLDGYFCDHAVLQRDCIIPVCGYAVPDTVVEVTLCGISARSIAAPDGRFTVNLPPMSAAKNQSLCVANEGVRLCFNDISIGEVYLIAGQSNMEFSLKGSVPGPESVSDEEFESLRYFKIPVKNYYGRQRTLYRNWQKIIRADSNKISGCGIFFGRSIALETGVVVGLVEASLGGISIESWVSRETLLAHPAYRQELLDYERNVSLQWTDTNGKLPTFQEKLASGLKKLFPEVPDDGKTDAGWTKADFCDQDWETMLLPDSWTEAGHNHAGIFWFRRTIELPEEWIGHELEIHLGAIDKSDKVYFNGTLIGETGNACLWDYWATNRVYSIPADLVRTERNQITVQAGSMASICTDGGIVGPASEMYLECKAERGKRRVSLAGIWRYRESYDAGTVGMSFMRTLGAGAPESLHMLYDNMILPLTGLPMRGVLWYQGEANAICTAQHYETLLKGMLEDWRRTLGNPELDFFIVQLPEYHNPHYFAPYSQWALIREAQANTAAQDPHADCIVTLGWGDTVELHCQNKKAVGEAAARCAIARLNGKLPDTGPRLNKISRKEQALELTFSGVSFPAIGTVLNGFVIAGCKGKAFAAQAEVTGPFTVKVSASEVPEPEYVWYAWGSHPSRADFQTPDGIPVSPFRAALNGNPICAEASNLIP